MSELSLKERIKKASLTAREAQTIHRLIEDIGTTVFLSGQQMSAHCQISATTMTRLIQKLGYSKFGAFKSDFEALYRETITPFDMFTQFIDSGTENELMRESIRNDYSNMTEMEASLDEATLRQAARYIAKAHKVYLVGMFSSEVVVRALGYYLWRMGKETEEITGLGMQDRFAYADIRSGSLLIAVSTQRIVKEVIGCVDFARKEGIPSIALTDNFTNPLARAADHVLVAPVHGAVIDCTHVAMLSLINSLMNLVVSETPEVFGAQLRAGAKKADARDLFCV